MSKKDNKIKYNIKNTIFYRFYTFYSWNHDISSFFYLLAAGKNFLYSQHCRIFFILNETAGDVPRFSKRLVYRYFKSLLFYDNLLPLHCQRAFGVIFCRMIRQYRQA